MLKVGASNRHAVPDFCGFGLRSAAVAAGDATGLAKTSGEKVPGLSGQMNQRKEPETKVTTGE